MNLTGLEQFHQGKSDDETHRSPLEASQSQVHRAEGSADGRLAQGPGVEIALRAAAAPSVFKIGLIVIASPFYARAMITKISALIAVVGFACTCILQAQSPSPAESPSPSQTPVKHRAMKKATATPAPARHPAPSPSPGKFSLNDLFKPKTSGAAASPAAAAPAPAKGTSAQAATKAPAPGGGHGKVWVNTETHVYHKEGSHFYGTTKKGKYMTEAEAIKEGNKAAQR